MGQVIDGAGSPPPLTLRRELGKWDLTAIGINQVIGSAIFILPSQVAAQIGNWSPVAFWRSGSRRCSSRCASPKSAAGSKGPADRICIPARPSADSSRFEVGWMQWVTRVTSQAASPMASCSRSVSTGLPSRPAPAVRSMTLGHHARHRMDQPARHPAERVRHRSASRLPSSLPLTLFILVGLWFVDASRLPPSGAVSLTQMSTAALLLDLRVRRLRRHRRTGR